MIVHVLAFNVIKGSAKKKCQIHIGDLLVFLLVVSLKGAKYSSMSHNTCTIFVYSVGLNPRELSWPKFLCSLERRCSIVGVPYSSKNICTKVMKTGIKVYHTMKVRVLLILQIPLK